MTEPLVTLAAEGVLDLAVLRRLARDAGLVPHLEYGRRGKSQIDLRLAAYDKAARYAPWIVLRDLDNDGDCAGQVARQLLPHPAKLMVFRIAVRTVESWLLSDRQHFKSAFRVDGQSLPLTPDRVDRPKSVLLDVVAKSSSREIKSAMLRRMPNGGWTSGPEYNALLEEFADKAWQPSVAADQSPSLTKARLRIRELAQML